MVPSNANVALMVRIAIPFCFALLWLGLIIWLRIKGQQNFVYLLFFTIFYVYFYQVLDYTLFQFQSLLILRLFAPNMILRGLAATESTNLVPLVTLTIKALKTSLLNILLFVPFGFGLPFITKLRLKTVVLVGALVSVGIELIQFVSGRIAGLTFRVTDINDVIFNTTGAAIGYLLFVGFVRIVRALARRWNAQANPFLEYVAARPQINEA